MCVYVHVWCVCVNVCLPVSRHVCGDQKTALWSQFFPSTLRWVLETEFRSSGLYSNDFYLPSHLVGQESKDILRHCK